MSTRRRVGRGRPSGGRPRARLRGVFWDDTEIDQSLANNSTAGVALDGGIPEDELKGLTVTRTIIRLAVGGQTINTSGLFHLGIYLAENDAAAALAFPEVQDTLDDAGWLIRLPFQKWGTGGNTNDFQNFLQVREDIRAMRKYPGEDYTNIILLTNTSASGTINVDGVVRTLYKRP